jgi:hypothetical protein
MVNEVGTGITKRADFPVMGLGSFILAGAATCSMFVLSILNAIIEQASSGDVYSESATAAIILAFILTLMFANLIAFILGLIGLTKKTKSKNYAFWGVFISVAANLVAFILMID